MDETYVMNQVKEDACFVSQDFMKDIEIARKKGEANTIVRDYVLPDFTTIRRGYIRPPGQKEDEVVCAIVFPPQIFACRFLNFSCFSQQTLRLNNERFSVPEILFHPTDIGIQQMGIPEAVLHSISACPPETHPHLFSNILLTGGSAFFPGYRDRIEKEVRSLAPDHYDVNVTLPDK